jgi:hypothetical protein
MSMFERDSKTMMAFIGEVSEPYSSPTVTRGLIEFRVHPLQGNLQLYQKAQLISQTGEISLVMVRATSYKQFEQSSSLAWQPGDFRVRVDGIDLVQAQTMQKLQQEPLSEDSENS